MKITDSIKSVSAGTWVRLVLLVAVLVNNAVALIGSGSADGTTVGKILTIVITVCASLLAYWKNNSFTQAAQAADRIMNEIKNIKNSENF